MNYGDWVMKHEDNTVSLNAFVTVEKNFDCENIKKDSTVCYKYSLYLRSNSEYNNELTSTWVYGGRIVVNKEIVTQKQFPDGFIILVGVEPTLVYSYETDKKDNNLNLGITWDKAVYEPRIRK